MKLFKSLIGLFALVGVLSLLNACNTPPPAPTVAAATVAAPSAPPTALPTNTSVPPTNTPVPTEAPTNTPTDTPTMTPTATTTSTPTATSTATRTATRKPTPRPTNTLAPITSAQLLKPRGSGRVTVVNNYNAPVTLKVADKTYTIPALATDFPLDVGPGQYTWTAIVPGIAQGSGALIVMSGWDSVLALGRRS